MSLLSLPWEKRLPFTANKHRERKGVLWFPAGLEDTGVGGACLFPGRLGRTRVGLGIWALEQN